MRWPRRPAHLDRWLAANHGKATELWIRMYKKGSGRKSVTWDDCVLVALCWGWIDGQRKALDDVSFLQRFTPRRKQSTWSQKNRAHAERLIAGGPHAARRPRPRRGREGRRRWAQAYAGSAAMVMPEDFLAAVSKDATAKKLYATLDRRTLLAIYHRVVTAKKPETRAKRIAVLVAKLARREALY